MEIPSFNLLYGSHKTRSMKERKELENSNHAYFPMEQARVIETPSPVWKTGVLAIIRRLRIRL